MTPNDGVHVRQGRSAAKSLAPRATPDWTGLRQPRLPSCGNSLLMENTKDLNSVRINQVVHAIRKSSKQHSTRSPILNCIRLGIQSSPLNRRIQFKQELNSKTAALALVPLSRLADIRFGFGSNSDEIQRDRRRARSSSRTSAQGFPGCGFARNASRRSSRIALW